MRKRPSSPRSPVTDSPRCMSTPVAAMPLPATAASTSTRMPPNWPTDAPPNFFNCISSKEIVVSNTHNTARTQFAAANGVRYAYRQFGSGNRPPLLCLQHFRGGLDNWDPAVTDGLAEGGPVILFNNAGIASSGGEPADTIAGMAEHVIAFVEALGLTQIDLLGFSMGGF